MQVQRRPLTFSPPITHLKGPECEVGISPLSVNGRTSPANTRNGALWKADPLPIAPVLCGLVDTSYIPLLPLRLFSPLRFAVLLVVSFLLVCPPTLSSHRLPLAVSVELGSPFLLPFWRGVYQLGACLGASVLSSIKLGIWGEGCRREK